MTTHGRSSHPLADRALARLVRWLLVRGGVPKREARDQVQSVLMKTFAAAAPGTEKPEEWKALACAIATGEALYYRRKRATERKHNAGLTDETEVAALDAVPTDRIVEAKQQLGCVRQVLERHGVHPLARQIAEAHAAGESRGEISARLGIAKQTVTNILSRLRRAFGDKWEVEKIVWAIAFFMIVVFGMPGLVQHLRTKREVADENPDDRRRELPATSASVQSDENDKEEEAERVRAGALKQCAAGKYLDCLAGLDEAKDLDPAGDEAPEVQQARRTANERLGAPQQDAKPGARKHLKP